MKGVWFENKHSYSDFGLVLKSKSISLPSAKTYTIEVPCSDGVLDLSTALTGGKVNYKNRTIKMDFTILSPFNQLESVKSMIANHIHGKTMNVRFDADPEFYYTGRCSISEFKTDVFPATMVVEVDAEPYKLDVNDTVITESVSGTKTITIALQKMQVVPTINVSANMTLTYKTKLHNLLSGDNIIPSIILSSGENNVLTFNGTGTVQIKFRGGEL